MDFYLYCEGHCGKVPSSSFAPGIRNYYLGFYTRGGCSTSCPDCGLIARIIYFQPTTELDGFKFNSAQICFKGCDALILDAKGIHKMYGERARTALLNSRMPIWEA